MHNAHILPKPAHFGCMAAICCQGRVLFLSKAPFRMHEAKNLPRVAARERTTARNLAAAGRWVGQLASILPSTSVRGRIAAKYCRRQSLENAFREDLAMDECPDSPRGKQRPSSRNTTPKAGSGERPTTKIKEGERFARLLSLFSFTARVAQDLRSDKPPTFGIPLGWGFRVRRNCASRPICR